jgi:2-dehydro-3-deoxygluconokinase
VSTADGSVTCFGELLMRLDAPSGWRLVQTDRLDVSYTGAEANVAVSLAVLGLPSSVVSVVPDNPVGRACINALRRYGVECGDVGQAPGRLGVFFHEPGGAGRAAQVLYDRAGSAFASSDPSCYDWPAILGRSRWLHVSGTAPAVSAGAAEALRQGLSTARSLGVPVSLDLNYRATLWSPEQARAALTPLLADVDLFLGAGPDAVRIFDLGLDADRLDLDGHQLVAERLRDDFGLARVAATVRELRGTATLTGLFLDADGVSVSRSHPVVDSLGRIGTGDAFAAGLLYGHLTGRDRQATVDLAAAAAHLKQSIAKDFNLVTLAEMEAVVAGESEDRVRR